MKLGRIELVHSFLGETGYVILLWVKTESPLASVIGYVTGTGLGAQNATNQTRVVYPAAHSQQTLLIEDLDPVMFLVRAYRSADGVSLDTQINEIAVDAGSRSTYSTTTYEYVVDRGYTNLAPVVTGDEVWADPVDGSIELRDERLLDQDYAVFMRGLGQRRADEITDRTDAGGGFDLAVPLEVFNSGDTIFVTVQNRVDATGESGSGSGAEVSDVFPITEDQDFDAATMNGKLLYVNYPGAVIGVLTFPNLSLIADSSFKVATHGGAQTYLSLQLDAGDTVRFQGDDKNVIHLGKSEEISIMIRNNIMYVLSDGTNYKRLGQRIWGDKLELNSVYRDGTQYTQASQPRMMEFVDSLPGGQVISEAAWAAGDKSKFARDDVGGTIRVPDSRTKFVRAVSAVDGSVVPGVSQTELIKKFWAGVITKLVFLKVDGTNTETSTDADPTLVQPNIRTPVEVDQTQFGTETRPVNEGLLPLLII